MLILLFPVNLRGTWIWLYVRAPDSDLLIQLVPCLAQVAKPFDGGKEEVRSPTQCGELRQSFDLLADGPLRDGHVECAVLRAADRIVLVAELVEGLIVHPHIHRKLELADEAGAADECSDASLYTIFGRVFWQRGPIGTTAADHPATLHVHSGVARIHPADVCAKRTPVAVGIHLTVIEIVVALHVRAELGIILVGRQR